MIWGSLGVLRREMGCVWRCFAWISFSGGSSHCSAIRLASTSPDCLVSWLVVTMPSMLLNTWFTQWFQIQVLQSGFSSAFVFLFDTNSFDFSFQSAIWPTGLPCHDKTSKSDCTAMNHHARSVVQHNSIHFSAKLLEKISESGQTHKQMLKRYCTNSTDMHWHGTMHWQAKVKKGPRGLRRSQGECNIYCNPLQHNSLQCNSFWKFCHGRSADVIGWW